MHYFADQRGIASAANPWLVFDCLLEPSLFHTILAEFHPYFSAFICRYIVYFHCYHSMCALGRLELTMKKKRQSEVERSLWAKPGAVMGTSVQSNSEYLRLIGKVFSPTIKYCQASIYTLLIIFQCLLEEQLRNQYREKVRIDS